MSKDQKEWIEGQQLAILHFTNRYDRKYDLDYPESTVLDLAYKDDNNGNNNKRRSNPRRIS